MIKVGQTEWTKSTSSFSLPPDVPHVFSSWLRIPGNPTSDSDLKASTVPTQSIQYVRRLRRWGEYHFRSGWLRSNPKLFLVETRIF
jgi:hypothetical protein